MAHLRVFLRPFARHSWRAALSTFCFSVQLSLFFALARSSRVLSLLYYMTAYNGVTVLVLAIAAYLRRRGEWW
jgi:hypothetical protein